MLWVCLCAGVYVNRLLIYRLIKFIPIVIYMAEKREMLIYCMSDMVD